MLKKGIPQVLYFGDFGGYKVLITKLLGNTLQDLKEETPKNKFKLNTVLKIAIQMVNIGFLLFSVFELNSPKILKNYCHAHVIRWIFSNTFTPVDF